MNDTYPADMPATPSRRGLLTMPREDSRFAHWKETDRLRLRLQGRLGPTPSEEALEAAQAAIDADYEIGRLKRRRADKGELSDLDSELLNRWTHTKMRAMGAFERHARPPCAPVLSGTLAPGKPAVGRNAKKRADANAALSALDARLSEQYGPSAEAA